MAPLEGFLAYLILVFQISVSAAGFLIGSVGSQKEDSLSALLCPPNFAVYSCRCLFLQSEKKKRKQTNIQITTSFKDDGESKLFKKLFVHLILKRRVEMDGMWKQN